MLRKLLSSFAPLSLGFALWAASQKSPDIFRKHEKIAQYLGLASICFGLTLFLRLLIAWIKAKNKKIISLQQANSTLREQLGWRDLENASRAIDRCRELWEGNNDGQTESANYQDDPVYLQARLDKGLSKIVAQPIVQRLNHIKQLSFAYLSFRSATHTRLAHSLGACRNAELVMRKIFQEGSLYTRTGEEKIGLTEEDKTHYLKLARVAALVHDLGHGPFSHALEIHLRYGEEGKSQIRPDKPLSSKYVDRYLRQAISEADVDPDEVLALINKNIGRFTPWMHFIGDLIDSPLDVDRMDYLARDAHMTGLSIGALNMQALIERIVPFKEVEEDQTIKIELAFDRSAVPYIEQFLYARDVMYLNCYERAQKVVAERMLGRAFDEFRKGSGGTPAFEPERLALLTDQQIVEIMLAHSGPSTITSHLIKRLMKGVTFEMLEEVPIQVQLAGAQGLQENALDKLPTEIRRWAEAALQEDYAGAYLDIPADWAKALARRTGGTEESQIIVTVPSWSVVDHWQREGEIRILQKNVDGTNNVDYVYRISKVLNDFIRALAGARLILRLFVDPDLSTKQKEGVLKEFRSMFSGSQP